MSVAPVIKQSTQDGRKIPEAIFITDVPGFCKKYGMEAVTNGLNSAYNKFKLTEGQFSKYRNTAKKKIPEIKRTVELIEHLKANNEKAIQTKFQLSDGVYAFGEIPEKIDQVGLWLGADLMVEYNLEEAEKFLNTNLDRAEQNVATYNEDLAYLKEQITTCEVNIARVHNHQVAMKKKEGGK